MADKRWYNKSLGELFSSGGREVDIVKLNPAQPFIREEEGWSVSTKEVRNNYTTAYEHIEVVNRAVNMIVNAVASIPVKIVDDERTEGLVKNVRRTTVLKMLNESPNQHQDVSSFKRNLVMDLLMDGNSFIYFDGGSIYQLIARKVSIAPGEKNYIAGYEYDQGRQMYTPTEVIHIKENSYASIYRGVPRLKAALRSIDLMLDMRDFQNNFFENGTVTGLVIKTPNTMSEKIKERTIRFWQSNYNPKSGGRRPMILDGGTEVDTISNVDFDKLDFQESMKDSEETVLQCLGVPPILLEGGNNANIRPNHRLFYLETVLPIVQAYCIAYSRFFGWKIQPDVSNIPALQPELSEQAAYYSTLTNGGIITGNEARKGIGVEPLEDEAMNEIRIPANIAGSAGDPSQGGRPPENDS